jgi:hypothetical protein
MSICAGGGRWVAGVEIGRKDEINVSPLIISHRVHDLQDELNHRVGRVLSFFPVVGIGTPPILHPQASGLPPFGSGGGGEGVGESQFRRGDRHCGTLYNRYVRCELNHGYNVITAEIYLVRLGLAVSAPNSCKLSPGFKSWPLYSWGTL